MKAGERSNEVKRKERTREQAESEQGRREQRSISTQDEEEYE